MLLERTGTPAHLNTVACLTVLPTVAVPATAVTGSVGIDVLVPTTFSAVTVKEYELPGCRPSTAHVTSVVSQVNPSGSDVTTKASTSDAVQDTTTRPPATATAVTASGGAGAASGIPAASRIHGRTDVTRV